MEGERTNNLRRIRRDRNATFRIMIVIRTSGLMRLTPLMIAVKLNFSARRIERIIEIHGQVNAIRTLQRLTALHLARRADLITLLLNHNANVKIRDAKGQTPLLKYLFNRRDEACVMALLLRSTKESVNILNARRESAIDVAIVNRYSFSVISKIIEIGDVRVNFANGYVTNWLSLALNYNDDVRIVKMLLNIGADVNHVDIFGDTVLHVVSHPGCFNLLLSYGAHKFINVKNWDGDTPLMGAVKKCKENRLIKLLLINGADPNLRDNNGRTPAFFTMNRTTLSLLLVFGADLTIKDNDGKTAWDYIYSTRLSGRLNSCYIADSYMFLMKIVFLLGESVDRHVDPFHRWVLSAFVHRSSVVVGKMNEYEIFDGVSLYDFCEIVKFNKGFPVKDGLDKDFLKGIASRLDIRFYKDVINIQSEKYRLYCFASNLKDAVRKLKIASVKSEFNNKSVLSEEIWSRVVNHLSLAEIYSFFLAAVVDD